MILGAPSSSESWGAGGGQGRGLACGGRWAVWKGDSGVCTCACSWGPRSAGRGEREGRGDKVPNFLSRGPGKM